MKQADKIALQEWERLKADIVRATPVDRKMTHAERDRHRIQLEANPIEWIKFFCAPYVKSEFADFQRRAIRRIVAHDECRGRASSQNPPLQCVLYCTW